MTERRRQDPEDLTPEDARERWLNRKRADGNSETTIYTYGKRLGEFLKWCDEVGLERVGDIRPIDLDEYHGVRSRKVAEVSLENEMRTLKLWVEYLDEKLDAVEDGLAKSVRVPDVDREDRSDETILTTERALTLLEHYRTSDDYGTRDHAMLEIAWATGARRGGLRAIDVRDVDFEAGYIDFVHRPETDTPLKNKMFGQRSVSLPDECVRAVQTYIREHRYEVHDDEGRQPLLASSQGRPRATTVASWSYKLTEPCIHSDCPHGRDPRDCDYRRYNQASKCPSSRSPHPIRSGSITWQLNCGLPPEVVAGRVNASIDTIRWHYDWATESQRWKRLHEHREQRREFITNLTIES